MHPAVHPSVMKQAVRPPPPELTQMNGWNITSGQFIRIVSSERDEELCKELEVTRLPDQCFEGVYLKLQHKNTTVLDFNVKDLIAASRITKEEAQRCGLRCRYDDAWKDKKIEMHHTGLHWTYDMQKYTGCKLGTEGVDGGVIDMELLQDTAQPIRHFLAAPLMEDDLEDCGTSQVQIKFRAMPTCWFVLLRQFIRVDRVRASIKDVRWFHKFGTDDVVLHQVLRQKDISDMADAAAAAAYTDDAPPLQLYTNPDELARTLPIAEESFTTFKLPVA